MTSLVRKKRSEIVSLDAIAGEINELALQVEHSNERTAELLHIAREQFEYDRFWARGAPETENPIPFTT